VTADLGGIPAGPGAFDEDTARMGIAGCGDRPLRRRSPLAYAEGIRPGYFIAGTTEITNGFVLDRGDLWSQGR
jgi:hypothetical protein